MKYYSGIKLQRGRGLGSVLGRIFRGVIPIAKMLFNTGKKLANTSVGKQLVQVAKRTAIEEGANLASDVIKGQNVKASVKYRLSNATKKLGEQVEKMMTQNNSKPKKNKRKYTRPTVITKRSKIVFKKKKKATDYLSDYDSSDG